MSGVVLLLSAKLKEYYTVFTELNMYTNEKLKLVLNFMLYKNIFPFIR